MDEDAREYYRDQLYQRAARVFLVNDADIEKTRRFFEELWHAGKALTKDTHIRDTTRRRGKVIDVYDVTGSNCATHSVSGLRASGSKIFETYYTSLTTQIPIARKENFTIPISMQHFLIEKSKNSFSMDVHEMTKNFINHFPSLKNPTLKKSSTKEEIESFAAQTSSALGSSTGYSGGTTGGSLGASYELE
ncbi:hypothetical protein ABK905_23265 [Acerihabitans sp. KWT182]|uniref:Uncharacterized protein n=1 Tax=Acerihabitans sp. KWT182 TaxID=3157919 RepID=A0AAU7Q8A9_9GAMM